MLPMSAQILAHLRRPTGLATRKLFLHQPGVTDRRGLGSYVLPPNDAQPPRVYDADGNEVRRVWYDK